MHNIIGFKSLMILTLMITILAMVLVLVVVIVQVASLRYNIASYCYTLRYNLDLSGSSSCYWLDDFRNNVS